MSFLRPFARLMTSRSPIVSSATLIAAHLSHLRPRATLKPFLWAASAFALTASFTLGRIHLDAGESETTITGEDNADVIIDPASGVEFPKVIRVGSKIKIPPLSLIGVGIRKVSFLGVKVYSVGFYADLTNPNLQITNSMTPEEKFDHIVKNTACVLKIIPTRSTSYTHLRDAFLRALNSRLSAAIKNGSIAENDAIEAGGPIRKIRTLFPNSTLEKHQPLDVFLPPPILGRPRALIFRDLGAVESDFIATEFFLHYFIGASPSPPLKEMIASRLQSIPEPEH